MGQKVLLVLSFKGDAASRQQKKRDTGRPYIHLHATSPDARVTIREPLQIEHACEESDGIQSRHEAVPCKLPPC
eukprot:5953848-Pleurochrysis_carterae.AAC.1